MIRQHMIATAVVALFALVVGVVIGTVIAPKDEPVPEDQEIIVQLIIDTPIEAL